MDPLSLQTLLDEAAASRKALKQHAKTLDAAGPGAKSALLELARRQGVELPDEAAEWPAKRLIRRALDRQGQARERLNPQHLDEAFTCASCGADVSPGGRPVRDHCPHCLCSLHVDIVPGDRAATCRGILAPVGAELRAGRWVIRYRCRLCGHEQNNRAHPEDDHATLARISALEA